MKIVWNQPASKLFRELSVGDVFSYNGILYMAIPYIIDEKEGGYNAVNLEKGSVIYFYQQDAVTPRNCEIVVK